MQPKEHFFANARFVGTIPSRIKEVISCEWNYIFEQQTLLF